MVSYLVLLFLLLFSSIGFAMVDNQQNLTNIGSVCLSDSCRNTWLLVSIAIIMILAKIVGNALDIIHGEYIAVFNRKKQENGDE